jgi:hypothetical protein
VQYNETMSKWLVPAVVSALASGCYSSSGAFVCKTSTDCTGGPAGVCQPNGSCSFQDSTCPSMQRYGGLSGGLAGQCVGEQPPPVDAAIDAQMIDAAPDAPQTCFGTGLLRICLASAPSDSLTISATTPLDTDNPQMCALVTSGGTGLCVVAATTISVEATWRATGGKPLVLIARDSITITATGLIDVASRRGVTPEIGAGGDAATCDGGTAPKTGGGTNGGGAGGSFTGLGGNGGKGGGGGGGAAGLPGAAVTAITELRGGCPGQIGQGVGANKGAEGHGGGAVYLIAGGTISVAGAINASGEGGGHGVSGEAGGGGGGSGGMIGFDAQTITGTGLILANGGGGGEASGTTAPGASGNDGKDPTSISAAPGGTGGSTSGGDGGNGSTGVAAGPGADGASGASGGSGGGGGGGGGAGLIKAPTTASLGVMVSPLAIP